MIFDNKNEMAGSFTFDDDRHFVSNGVIFAPAGSTTSVKTPNALVNFHTHPLSAYQQNTSVYGWPSGEDFREAIRFSLKGNHTHVVFTLEGIYLVQIHPTFISFLKKIDSSDIRGGLICAIEEYFKELHYYRSFHFVKLKKDLNILHRFIQKSCSFTLKKLKSTLSYTGFCIDKHGNTSDKKPYSIYKIMKYLDTLDPDIMNLPLFYVVLYPTATLCPGRVILNDSLKRLEAIEKNDYKYLEIKFLDDDEVEIPFLDLRGEKRCTEFVKNLH
jgi:hypothetical protein